MEKTLMSTKNKKVICYCEPVVYYDGRSLYEAEMNYKKITEVVVSKGKLKTENRQTTSKITIGPKFPMQYITAEKIQDKRTLKESFILLKYDKGIYKYYDIPKGSNIKIVTPSEMDCTKCTKCYKFRRRKDDSINTCYNSNIENDELNKNCSIKDAENFIRNIEKYDCIEIGYEVVNASYKKVGVVNCKYFVKDYSFEPIEETISDEEQQSYNSNNKVQSTENFNSAENEDAEIKKMEEIDSILMSDNDHPPK